MHTVKKDYRGIMSTENMRKLVNVITVELVECTAGYIYCTVILRPICYFFLLFFVAQKCSQFLTKCIETLFSLFRVLLVLQKYILSGAIKFHLFAVS